MLKKYLITGFSGFVSWHFLEYLENNKINAIITGIDVIEPNFNYKNYSHITCTFKKVDLLNQNDVKQVLQEAQPNYILHLASYSSVAYSWENPHTSYTNNTNIFLNILEEVRASKLQTKILSIGSSEEYGNVNPTDVPLKETHALNPISPYAVARVSQEMLSKIYADGFGLDIILTRSFNHIGIKQKDSFVIPSFAKQLNTININPESNQLTVGDISVIRDFVDVRDVVDAYYKLFEKGKSGEVYNICTGNGISLKEIIGIMTDILSINVKIVVNEKIIRPNDNKIIIGCNEKIKNHTGWKNNYSIKESLTEILNYYK